MQHDVSIETSNDFSGYNALSDRRYFQSLHELLGEFTMRARLFAVSLAACLWPLAAQSADMLDATAEVYPKHREAVEKEQAIYRANPDDWQACQNVVNAQRRGERRPT